MVSRRLPKFQRVASALADRQITSNSIAIIRLIAAYHFLPTSLLVALAPCSKNITHRHLQLLFHRGLINRFSFPRVGNPGEFHYYLDNSAALAYCEEADSRLKAVVSRNKQKRYCDVHDLVKAENMQGKLLFLKHEVMISNFHANLAISARDDNSLRLEAFRQGPVLYSTVVMPETPVFSHGTTRLGQTERTVSLRPDAFATLHFPNDRVGANRAHYFFEADRETEDGSHMRAKFATYLEYVVAQRRHVVDFSIPRVRAVLIECLTAARVRLLLAVVEGLYRSVNLGVPLFWFSAESHAFRANGSEGRCFVRARMWHSSANGQALSLAD